MGKYLPGSAGSPSVETQTTPTDEAAAVLNVCADITNQEGWGQKFGRTFVESLVATSVVQAKETPTQRKGLKKRIATEFRDREKELFAETSAPSFTLSLAADAPHGAPYETALPWLSPPPPLSLTLFLASPS